MVAGGGQQGVAVLRATRHLPPAVLLGIVVYAEAMPAHRDDVIMLIYLGQAITQAAHQGIDGLFRNADAICAGPYHLYKFVTAAHCTSRIMKQLDEAELGQ